MSRVGSKGEKTARHKERSSNICSLPREDNAGKDGSLIGGFISYD
jgi:hypothetical protein